MKMEWVIRPAAVLLVAVALASVAACDRRPATYTTPPGDGDTIRVVSLAPALTQMIVDMGQGDKIVGVAENDAAAPDGVPVVGTYRQPNYEKLIELHPTAVLMMQGKEGVPPRLTELARTQQFWLVSYPYPNKVGDVAEILADDYEFIPSELMPKTQEATAAASRPKSLGFVLNAQTEAGILKLKLLQQMSAIQRVVASEPQPRMLLVIGTNPVMASGEGTVLDDLLYYAGAENAAVPIVLPPPLQPKIAGSDKPGDPTVKPVNDAPAPPSPDGPDAPKSPAPPPPDAPAPDTPAPDTPAPDTRAPDAATPTEPAATPDATPAVSVMAPTFDREKLLTTMADVVVLLLPGAPDLEAADKDPRLAEFVGLVRLPAVAKARFVLINDPLGVLPATSVATVAAKLAKAAHPNLADQIDAAMAEAAKPPKPVPTPDLVVDGAEPPAGSAAPRPDAPLRPVPPPDPNKPLVLPKPVPRPDDPPAKPDVKS